MRAAGAASCSVGWFSPAIGYDASKLEWDEPFSKDVLATPGGPQTFQGSLGFRESIVAQIRCTNPTTVRE